VIPRKKTCGEEPNSDNERLKNTRHVGRTLKMAEKKENTNS